MSYQDNFETQGARFGNSVSNARDCKHGRLGRSCEICELIQELEEARLEAKAYREVAIRSCDEIEDYDTRTAMVSAEKQRLLDEWKKEEGKGAV